MAVTRTGIPVRVWCRPGNTTDSALIRQVKTDMRDPTLSRIVWVGDRGFSSATNRRYLRRGDHHYIVGEKLRGGSPEATAALSRAGRYATVAANMRVKEVRICEHERFVICHNPEGAERDAAVRAELLTRLGGLIDGTDALAPAKRAELRGVISTKPGLNRFLRVTGTGLLRIDKTKVKTGTRLDGKYLLRCSDPHLPAEDIAVGYTQLLEVERGWRDRKQIIDLRPVHHRLEDRIRAHVLLCWLALLLIADHREHHRHHLEPTHRRAGPTAPDHLHRPGRDLPTAHRDHPGPARHRHHPRAEPTQEDHRAGGPDRLTSHNTPA